MKMTTALRYAMMSFVYVMAMVKQTAVFWCSKQQMTARMTYEMKKLLLMKRKNLTAQMSSTAIGKMILAATMTRTMMMMMMTVTPSTEKKCLKLMLMPTAMKLLMT